MDNLHHEIESLKTGVRRQRYLNVGLLAALGGMALLVAARPEQDASFGTITCRAWMVVDQDGKVRIAAGTQADGDASVAWADRDGKARIAAGTQADGQAGVTWYDKDGKRRIAAGTVADDQASVTWFAKDETPRIQAATAKDGTTTFPTPTSK